jgi:hypothetical protein
MVSAAPSGHVGGSRYRSLPFPQGFPLTAMEGTMGPTRLELYEALKKSLNEDAARMIVEMIPGTEELATKADIARLDGRMAAFEHALAQLEVRLLRRTLSFFVPLWIAVLAALVTVILQGSG